jgi:uncharacterized membrane protein
MESAVSSEWGRTRAADTGRLLLALSFVVVGGIGFAAHDFVLNQEPVPKTLPWRETLACIGGALSFLVGLGLLVPQLARIAGLALTAYVSLWVLALELPRALADPGIEGNWLGVGEDLSLAAGCWAAYCSIASRKDASLAAARAAFGIALIPIGLSHFFYLKACDELIPTWVPWHYFWSILTGVAHIAAGLAITLRMVPRLAATLEAVMETLFTIIVWGNAIASMPGARDSWVNFFISLALSAAAWAVAGSYGRARWLSFVSEAPAPEAAPPVAPSVVAGANRTGNPVS